MAAGDYETESCGKARWKPDSWQIRWSWRNRSLTRQSFAPGFCSKCQSRYEDSVDRNPNVCGDAGAFPGKFRKSGKNTYG